MIDKTIRLLILLTAMMGPSRTEGLAAEPLPPRALARIGDHRFYHGPRITCAVLSPDGSRMASAACDFPALWNDLASDDGQRAGIATASFLRKPEASVAFLQQRLSPAKALDKKRLPRLIADLDADAFERREAASRELVRLGERAVTALRRSLRNRPSLEARRRIEEVLSKLEPCSLTPETLRTLRAIEVLEHIGTPAARRCLQKMGKGAKDARPTRDAQAALRRLAKRRE